MEKRWLTVAGHEFKFQKRPVAKGRYWYIEFDKRTTELKVSLHHPIQNKRRNVEHALVSMDCMRRTLFCLLMCTCHPQYDRMGCERIYVILVLLSMSLGLWRELWHYQHTIRTNLTEFIV